MTTNNANNVSDLYACLSLPRGSTCIRVLDVYGPSGSEDSHRIIQCDLRVINLESESCPSFAALSYVWGTESSGSSFIKCRGYNLRVTPNCHSALRHLKKKLGNFTIWIDAICINQEDECEKMSQILLMGDIYSKAQTMYAWLGDGTAASDRAMSYLETAGYLRYFLLDEDTLEDEFKKPRHWAAAWCAFKACLKSPIRMSPLLDYGMNRNLDLDQRLPNMVRRKGMDFARPEHTTYRDMNELLDREWIRRLWTYQEILLASNPVVVCGASHVRWGRFSLGITFLEYSGINYQDGIPIIATLHTWAKIASGRDYLLRLHESCDANIGSYRQKYMHHTVLHRYRGFIIHVGQKIRHARRLNASIMHFAIMILFFMVVGWPLSREIWGTATVTSTVPSPVVSAATKASSSAAACVVACAASDIAACSSACDAARLAAGKIANLSAKLTYQISYQMLDYAFGLSIGVLLALILTSFILHLGSARRKYPKLQYVPPAHNSEIDLVDGLCNRKSKERKDKAIAVQAVLQRLSNTALTPIDVTHSLEDIYKQLCINLIKVTDSLQFLIPASLSRFPGHPSWVPNWAADFDSFWLKPTLFRNTLLSATPGSRVHWRLDLKKNTTITVRGRQICTVARCYQFQKTSSAYDLSEKELHRSNLRSTLWCEYMLHKRDESLSYALNRLNYDLPQRITMTKILAWKRFMRNAVNRDTEKLLEDLESQDSLKPILQTQISICNGLAEKRALIFVTNHLHLEESPHTLEGDGLYPNMKRDGVSDLMARRTGIGSCDVRAGDSVVLIAGVSSPLIIRRNSTSTRLISPALVEGVMDGQIWDSSWSAEDLEEFTLS